MRASSADLSIDSPVAARSAGPDWLSLALIDARNRSLRALNTFEALGALHRPCDAGRGWPALAMVGRMGWLQEWWIARNVQRLRGEAAAHDSLRLASVDGRADAWFADAALRWWADDAQDAAAHEGPDANAVRAYLEATLEQSLDLLMRSTASDEALWVYRQALAQEDRLAEALTVLAQCLGTPPPLGDPGSGMTIRPPRDALWFPAQTHRLGSEPGGWVPVNERWAHDEAVPEFEIDAQAVSWQRFVEFAEDGGYDRESLWHPEGWRWVQAVGRRAPRGVERLRGGALVTRFGQLQQAPAMQAACHVNWYEADAWCRWAGRRLPTEVEWELAACGGRSRGFVWGEVWEWAAGSARPWAADAPQRGTDGQPCRVLRGASAWTVARAAHVRQRRFVVPTRDELFSGFRSCAL